MGRGVRGFGIFDLGNQPDLLEGIANRSGIGDRTAPHGLVVFLSWAADYHYAALARIC